MFIIVAPCVNRSGEAGNLFGGSFLMAARSLSVGVMVYSPYPPPSLGKLLHYSSQTIRHCIPLRFFMLAA